MAERVVVTHQTNCVTGTHVHGLVGNRFVSVQTKLIHRGGCVDFFRASSLVDSFRYEEQSEEDDSECEPRDCGYFFREQIDSGDGEKECCDDPQPDRQLVTIEPESICSRKK